MNAKIGVQYNSIFFDISIARILNMNDKLKLGI
jgi:hypothetical protein